MLLAFTGPQLALIVCMLVLTTFFFLATFGVFWWNVSPWMRAYMSGTPITIFDILGMRFRRIDVKAVLKALIMARQAGVALSCRQMQRAYLLGVDLEKLTLAMIHAKKEGMEVTFEELVESDLEDRLAEKLKLHTGSAVETARASGPTAAGAEADSIRICPKCSKPASGDSKICRNCGAIL
jgi:uncharacterized protein YqfA (UPF0365 family)